MPQKWLHETQEEEARRVPGLPDDTASVRTCGKRTGISIREIDLLGDGGHRTQGQHRVGIRGTGFGVRPSWALTPATSLTV